MRSTRVVIADRHPVILVGLSSVLDAQPDFKIAARCRDGRSCIKAIRDFRPDIAILDVSMPDITGLEVLATVASGQIPTRVVFFTGSAEEHDLHVLTAAGAHAVIPMDAELDLLLQMLRQVANGHRLLQPSDPAVFQEQSTRADTDLILTDRERQIIRLVCEGLSNKEIGRRLNITDGTIKVHLHHIFEKLEIGNRTALVSLAASHKDAADHSPGNHGAARRSRKASRRT
jgi:two-component system, NarL family, nitrate/nitrite response regulator NarL